MCNGHCYDMALLISQAFLDEEDDVSLVYASIDSLRLNPIYAKRKDPLIADHCFVERITKDGHYLIYDTSSGFVYDKNIYWKMEHPKVRKINDKNLIKEFVKDENLRYSEDIEKSKYASILTLPCIESTYGRISEKYSCLGIELLQREIEYFKKVINYEEVCKEVHEDMKRLGLKREKNK